MTGISHWVDTDEETGITRYGADQNMDAILDLNHIEYNADHGRLARCMAVVASIPMVAFAQILATGAIGEDGEVRDDVELSERRSGERPERQRSTCAQNETRNDMKLNNSRSQPAAIANHWYLPWR